MSATYQFEVLIKQTEEGQYLAAVPILPGCFSTGNTEQEATQKAISAARCYCWNMLENGAPIPQIVSGAPAIVKEISIQL
jgi:predicted RNase H-like HicB family nuclease